MLLCSAHSCAFYTARKGRKR